VRAALNSRELRCSQPPNQTELCSVRALQPARPEQRPSVVLESRAPATSVDGHAQSTLAFHGSAAENTWSIVRCGLLNLSGTTLQRNGSAFGSGIYMSTNVGVAYNFCAPTVYRWPNSALGNDLHPWGTSRLKEGVSFTDSHSRSVAGAYTSFLFVCTVAGDGKAEQRAASSALPETYMLVQHTERVRVEYILAYTDAQACSTGAERRAFKMDWCSVLMIAYVVLLVAVGLANSGDQLRAYQRAWRLYGLI
jgi:hypothetical protein